MVVRSIRNYYFNTGPNARRQSILNDSSKENDRERTTKTQKMISNSLQSLVGDVDPFLLNL